MRIKDDVYESQDDLINYFDVKNLPAFFSKKWYVELKPHHSRAFNPKMLPKLVYYLDFDATHISLTNKILDYFPEVSSYPINLKFPFLTETYIR